MLHPPPRQPLPHGAISHRYSVPGFGSLVAVSPDTPERSSLRPWHGYPVLSPHTAAPYVGGGRRPRSGREVGVVDEYRSTRDTGDRGGGCSIPLPCEPLPHGAIPHRDSVPGSGSLFAVSPDTPERSSLRPWHGIRCYRPTLPAPYGGGGRRPRSGRAVGVFPRTPFNQRRRRQGRGKPSPPPPSPDLRYPIDTVSRSG
jgi:hypothetical protein